MSANVLITGAAGYIGGSIVADFSSRRTGPLEKTTIFAAARSAEQVEHLKAMLHGVNVVQLDVSDAKAVERVILDNKIGLVVHTTSSSDGTMAYNIVQSLGRLREKENIVPHLVHTSLTTSYTAEAGWPYGELDDKQNVYQLEKKLDTLHPVIQTNMMVVEESKKQGVCVSLVVVPIVYGQGYGEWRKVSILIPLYIRTAVARGVMNKPEDDNAPQAVHVDDMVSLYRVIVERILEGKAVPTGEEGYIFGFAHRLPWWKTLDAMAEKMYARGLVKQAKAEVFSSYDEAAEALSLPREHVRAMIACGGDLVGTKGIEMGWKPQWDEARMLAHVDDEIQAVVDHVHVTSSLFSKLIEKERIQH